MLCAKLVGIVTIQNLLLVWSKLDWFKKLDPCHYKTAITKLQLYHHTSPSKRFRASPESQWLMAILGSWISLIVLELPILGVLVLLQNRFGQPTSVSFWHIKYCFTCCQVIGGMCCAAKSKMLSWALLAGGVDVPEYLFYFDASINPNLHAYLENSYSLFALKQSTPTLCPCQVQVCHSSRPAMHPAVAICHNDASRRALAWQNELISYAPTLPWLVLAHVVDKGRQNIVKRQHRK